MCDGVADMQLAFGSALPNSQPLETQQSSLSEVGSSDAFALVVYGELRRRQKELTK
jgi:hypothetical protein